VPIEGSTQLAVAPVDRPPGTIAAPQLEPTVARAVAFLRERAVESIAVADIADAVGYSEFHFTRLFTGALGVSPGRYLAAVRFQRAKELLLTGDAGVLDVCHAVGFASTGTFTRRFTDHVGVAPASCAVATGPFDCPPSVAPRGCWSPRCAPPPTRWTISFPRGR
jgi:transcriptional regulator GlxA family with amidase domain